MQFNTYSMCSQLQERVCGVMSHSLFSRTKKKTASQFGYGVKLLCLTVLAGLSVGQVKAEETPTIAQASSLPSSNSGASSLAGLTGSYTAPSDPSAAKPSLVAQKAAPVADTADDEPVDLLGEYNVTAQRRRTTERENTQTTYSVTKEQIKAFGARTVTDALKLIPGFTFADTLGGVVSDTSNYLRGLNSQRFLFLIDGANQGRASNNRADTIGTLPVALIERIEVTVGPSGVVRYGADAIAGVIQIITKIPEGPPKIDINVQGGSYGFSQYDLSYQFTNGKASDEAGYFGAYLGYQRSSAYNDYNYTYNYGTVTAPGTFGGSGTTFVNGAPAVPNGIYPAGTSYDGTTFSVNTTLKGAYFFSDYYYGKAIFKPGKDHTISVSVDQQNRSTGSAGNRTGCIPYGYRYQYNGAVISSPINSYCYGPSPSSTRTLAGDARGSGDTNSANTRVNAIWEWNLSELNTLKTQFAYNNTFLNFANPGSQGLINNRILEASTEYIAQLYPGNTLNIGYQFRTLRSTQQSTLPAGALPPLFVDREATTNALFATEALEFYNKALIINLGARYTNAVAFGNSFNYQAGIRYNFGSDDPSKAPFGLRFNYATAFKQPSISDLYVSGVINSAANPFQQFVANPALQPEKAQGYDIGFDINLSPSATFRATYYRIDITDYFGDGSAFIGNQPTIGGIGFGGQDCNNLGVDADGNPIPPSLGNGCLAQSFQSRNAQSYLTTGFEFVLDWQLDSAWRVSLSQNFSDARPIGTLETDFAQFNGIPTNAGYYYDYATPDIPFSQTGLLLTYSTPGFSAGLTGRFIGPRPTFGPYITPSYGQWDFTVRVPVSESITFTGGVFNIFNDRSILASGLRLSNSPANAGIISPPTTFRIGLEASF